MNSSLTTLEAVIISDSSRMASEDMNVSSGCSAVAGLSEDLSEEPSPSNDKPESTVEQPLKANEG